jgi:hypothetical protein
VDEEPSGEQRLVERERSRERLDASPARERCVERRRSGFGQLDRNGTRELGLGRGSIGKHIMTITTYDDLVDAIVDTLVDAELAAKAPRFIALAEARFDRLLFNLEGEGIATAVASAGVGSVGLPNDFKKMRSLHIEDAPSVVLSQMSLDDLRGLWLDAAPARPENYAIVEGELQLGPVPDEDYTLTMTYSKGVLALSPTNQSNWLLTAHPDLYLYSALIHAEFHGWNDERLPLIKSGVDEMVAEIQAADAIRRRADLSATTAGSYY